MPHSSDVSPPLPQELLDAILSAPFLYLATVLNTAAPAGAAAAAGPASAAAAAAPALPAAPPTPHLSLMCFTPLLQPSGQLQLVITTRRDTQKFEALLACPHVSLLLHDPAVALGISMAGTARACAAGSEEEQALRALHVARNPRYRQFMEGAEYAVIAVHVAGVRVSDVKDAVRSYSPGGSAPSAPAPAPPPPPPPPPPPLRLAVGSTNATKLAAAEQGFAALLQRRAGQRLEVRGVAAASGVAAQPMGDAQTRLGARNRALGALAAAGGCDYALGLEGGCSEEHGELVCFAWVCVVRAGGGPGAPQREACARSASFALPRAVAGLVRGGMELGAADDAVFGRTGSKHGEGAVGLLTRGAITRTSYYAHAVTCALVPFISAEHFEE